MFEKASFIGTAEANPKNVPLPFPDTLALGGSSNAAAPSSSSTEDGEGSSSAAATAAAAKSGYVLGQGQQA